MKRILAFLCTVLCFISLFACQKTPDDPQNEPAENAPFSVEAPEWQMISIWHFPAKGEKEDDGVVYSNALSKPYFEELVAEIESSVFTPDPTAKFDYSEYYDINFYISSGMQYRISVSVNGVVSAEKQFCRVSKGAFSFARVGGYFEMFQNLPADSAGN